MLKNMTVGKKIAGGFSLVLFLLIALGFIAYTALNKANDGFTEYRGMARDTNLAGQLQANMLMVRMNVKEYLTTESANSVKNYEEYFGKMMECLNEAKKEITSPERADKIKTVEESVAEYKTRFNKVVELTTLASKDFNEGLNVKGPQMEKQFQEIETIAEKEKNEVAIDLISDAKESLLSSRLTILKYIKDNNATDADRAKEGLKKSRKKAERLSGYQIHNCGSIVCCIAKG